MKTALWIIAICEIIRIVQNSLQLMTIFQGAKLRDDAYSEFVKSLKESDKQFVRNLLDEFEKRESE